MQMQRAARQQPIHQVEGEACKRTDWNRREQRRVSFCAGLQKGLEAGGDEFYVTKHYWYQSFGIEAKSNGRNMRSSRTWPDVGCRDIDATGREHLIERHDTVR